MTLVLKNYKPTKIKHEDLLEVKILEGEDIFVNLPIAVVDFLTHLEVPVLFGDYNGIPAIVELSEVQNRTKLFHLKAISDIPGSALEETTKESAQYSLRLPKDTPVNQLVIMNDEVLWAQPVVEEVEVNEDINSLKEYKEA